MNKTDSDKLAAIHRSAEINKLEIENMIDIFEKKMSIVENKLIEYECRYELTERQEDMMYKLQEQLNEMQDSIDSIEEVKSLNSEKAEIAKVVAEKHAMLNEIEAKQAALEEAKAE